MQPAEDRVSAPAVLMVPLQWFIVKLPVGEQQQQKEATAAEESTAS